MDRCIQSEAPPLSPRLSHPRGLRGNLHRNERSAAQPRPAAPIARCSAGAPASISTRDSSPDWMNAGGHSRRASSRRLGHRRLRATHRRLTRLPHGAYRFRPRRAGDTGCTIVDRSAAAASFTQSDKGVQYVWIKYALDGSRPRTATNYKARPWRNFEAVELAPLEWVDC
jgi:hypothetical protein